MSARVAGLAALLALTLAGCLPHRRVGHFGANAFYHARNHYRVRYASSCCALMPRGWILESYRFDAEGRPLEASTDPRFVETYARSVPTRRGAARYTVVAERFDLFFRRQDGGATMWARTIPLESWWAALDPSVLMRLAVAEIGRNPGAPDVLGLPGYRSLSVIVSDRSARIDGERAHAVTFDVTTEEPNMPRARRRVTVVGVPITQRYRWREARIRRPMLLVFGYATSPDAHIARRRAFESFVRRVDLH